MYRHVHRPSSRPGRTRGTVMIPLHVYPWDVEDGEVLPDGAYLFDGEDDGYGVDLPSCWSICDRCRGEGRHTNPNIDGNGLTSEDLRDWDEDQIEGYFSGRYDVPCEAGCSDGKVLAVDEDALQPWQRRLFDDWCQHEADSAREGRADARTRWYEDGCPQ